MRLAIGVLAMGLLLPMTAGQAADTFSDPKALVTAIFANYGPGQSAGDPTIYYWPRFKLLFDLSIGEPITLDDRSVINVSYHNFDHPRLLSIAMLRQDGNWLVDDVASMGNEDHWLLSWALTADPYGY